METQARAREGKATSQAEADVPTGADPAGMHGGGEIEIECVDEATAGRAHDSSGQSTHDALTLAVYARVYPTASFEAVEALKAGSRGLSIRRFKARELGAISSAISIATAGTGSASDLWAKCICLAEEVYRKDHRRPGRHKPLASVWIWRLKQLGRGHGSGPS